jgi:hypothetical protein
VAVTIVETVGSASANSFVTVAEADLYLEARLNSSAWTGTEPKKIALVEATRALSHLTWKGYRTDDVQALSFPRIGVTDPDAPSDAPLDAWSGTPEFDDDVIPLRVKEATYELALEFLRAGTTDIAGQDTLQNVLVKTIDVISTTYSDPAQREKGLGRFPRVMSLIGPLLDESASGNAVVRS